MKIKVSSDELADVISKEITEYSQEVTEALKENITEVANETQSRLKLTSPKRTGKYAKGWKIKKVYENKFDIRFVLFNTRYQLTHLLEFGHAKQNGGRTRDFPHIGPAEEAATQSLTDRMKKL